MLGSGGFASRYDFLKALQQFFKAKDFPQGNKRLPLTFPWRTPSGFIQDAVTMTFGSLIEVAIYNGHESMINDAAQDVVALVARDGLPFA